MPSTPFNRPRLSAQRLWPIATAVGALLFLGCTLFYVIPVSVTLRCIVSANNNTIMVVPGEGEKYALDRLLAPQQCQDARIAASEQRAHYTVSFSANMPATSAAPVQCIMTPDWGTCPETCLMPTVQAGVPHVRVTLVFDGYSHFQTAGSDRLLWSQSDHIESIAGFRFLAVGPGSQDCAHLGLKSLLAIIDKSVHPSWPRPLVVCSHGRPGNKPIRTKDNNVVVLTCDSQSSAEKAESLIRSLWDADNASPASLGGLIRRDGVAFLAYSLVGTKEEQDAFSLRARDAYYREVLTRLTRSIPLFPRRGAGWEDIIPGLLSMYSEVFLATDGVSAHDCAVALLGLSTYGDDNGLEDFLRSNCGAFGPVLQAGLIPNIEITLPCRLPEWTVDSVRRARQPDSDSNICRLGPDLCVNAGQAGFLETCGCVAKQLGGVARRAGVLKDMRRGAPLIVDCGDWMPVPHPDGDLHMERQELSVFLRAIKDMGFAALAVSRRDIELGALCIQSHDDVQLPVVAANVETSTRRSVVPYVVTTRGSQQVAIIGWVSSNENAIATACDGETVNISSDLRLLEHFVSEARAIASRIIVIGALPHGVCRRLIDTIEGIDIIATSVRDNPLASDLKIRPAIRATLRGTPYWYKNCLVVDSQMGRNGVDVFQLNDSMTEVLETLRIPLDEAVVKDGHIESLIDSLNQVTSETLSRVTGHEQGSYAGVTTCGVCHSTYVGDWMTTRHSQAFNTLVKIRRERHAACVGCHVTGFGEAHGFAEESRRHGLVNVQCEVCHGPGENHALSVAVRRCVGYRISKYVGNATIASIPMSLLAVLMLY